MGTETQQLISDSGEGKPFAYRHLLNHDTETQVSCSTADAPLGPPYILEIWQAAQVSSPGLRFLLFWPQWKQGVPQGKQAALSK